MASFFSTWLPGDSGRSYDDLGVKRPSRASFSRKSRRYFLPGLVICIVLRLEAFCRVSYDLQCSAPGIESWLPLPLILFELLPGQRRRQDDEEDSDDDGDDDYNTVFHDIGKWMNEVKLPLITGVLALSWGTYLSSSNRTRSTFICSRSQNTSIVVFLQLAGLLLDATIIIILWRILSWARTAKSRLKTLSSILLTSAVAIGVLYVLHRSRSISTLWGGLDSLYLFDIVIDSLMISIFLVSTALLAPDGSPLTLAGIISFVAGIGLAIRQTILAGEWENTSPAATCLSTILVCSGFTFFVYAKTLRSVAFIHRAFIVLFLVFTTLTATTYTIIVGSKDVDGHVLERLIYERRIEADRWLIHASVSNSLTTAVREYAERHDGRAPPSKFDVWFKFAKDRNSPILDHFAQMEKDLLPFWGLSARTLRERVRRVAEEPDISLVRIKNGTLVYDASSLSDASRSVLDDFSAMVKSFGEHLPEDLEFAVNLNERPRVLAPWGDISSGKHVGFSNLVFRRSSADETTPSAFHPAEKHVGVRELRDMTALACPPWTKARSGVHWDIRDFCAACARPQSTGQFLTEWLKALELCHQPDLLRLHGFHMTQSTPPPLQELLPVFSRSKTDSYSDILLPLRRSDESLELVDTGVKFDAKQKKLFWRGDLGGNPHRQLLYGGHQERLVHLINNATSKEYARVLLRIKPHKYSYVEASATELNKILPFDVGFIDPADKCGEDCAARYEFGFKTDTNADSIIAQSLMNQFVLVMDTDNGPPKSFLRVLRSGSVPFVSSIFKEWYSERLLPWVHFVPIDVRFHALHSTLAYFTGLGEKGLAKVNGKVFEQWGRPDNAKWIAQEGRSFASRALRREDMEVYLFRLLLEWARLVSDDREKMGFALPEK